MTSKNPLKKLSLFVDLKERRGLGDKREKRVNLDQEETPDLLVKEEQKGIRDKLVNWQIRGWNGQP